MIFFWVLLSITITVGVPLLIIFAIIRAIRGKGGKAKPVRYEDIVLWSIIISAAVVGLTAVFTAPSTLLGTDGYSQDSEAMLIYITAGGLLIALGIILKGLTARFLMSMGVLILIIGTIPYVGELGSVGVFFGVLVVFALLVWLIVRQSKKERDHG